MKLSLEQVRHVASLARLQLTPEEETQYQAQLSAVLGAVAQLDAIDTQGVPPMAQVTLVTAPPRADVVGTPLGTEAALRNAPARIDTSFQVPKIIE